MDSYVADVLGALTRSQFKARFVSASVNGKTAKPSYRLGPGDSFIINLADPEDRSGAALPEDIHLDVLYEDDNVIVVDKPQGMVVHPAHGNWQGTLANALLGHYRAHNPVPATGQSIAAGLGSGPGTIPRAGLVHRLDKDTSGVIIAGKTEAAMEYLAAQFRDRTTRKTYVAMVSGTPRGASGRLDSWLARDPRDRKRFAVAAEGTGRRAVTDWRVLAASGGVAVLALGLRTGRTHQLRVHCRSMGCPIVGDPVYGNADRRFPGATLMLHAWELRIVLPGNTGPSTFRAPVPDRMRAAARTAGLGSFPEPVPV